MQETCLVGQLMDEKSSALMV
ncbi:hypothetical protein EMIT0373P_30228 [Pseudomonas chlororaphis]